MSCSFFYIAGFIESDIWQTTPAVKKDVTARRRDKSLLFPWINEVLQDSATKIAEVWGSIAGLPAAPWITKDLQRQHMKHLRRQREAPNNPNAGMQDGRLFYSFLILSGMAHL